MHLLYEYSSALSLLSISIQGGVADDAVSTIQRQIRLITSQLEIECGIFDLSAADLSAISSETVRALASCPPMLPEQARRIVVTPPAYQYGMARMYEMASSRAIDICRSLDEAYALLEVSMPLSFQTVSLDATGLVKFSSEREQKAG